MAGGLRASLIGAVLTATAALVLTVLLVEDPLVEYRETRRIRDELSLSAGTAAGLLEGGRPADEVADQLGARTGSWIRVFGDDGRLLGDSALDGPALGAAEVAAGDEIRQARERGDGWTTREDPDIGVEYMHVAIALDDGRVVTASRALSDIQSARSVTRELIVVGGILAVLVFGLLAWVLSRTMVQPMKELTRVADALADGDLSIRMRSQRTDELGELGRSLDRMADRLEDQLQGLRSGEARLRTVLNAMVEAVFVTDDRGRIALTNRALDRLVGAEVLGRTPVEAIRSPELHEAVRRARRQGEAVEVELTVAPGDEPRHLVAEVAPLPGRAGVVAVLHDITELKRTDLIRRDFVANASHELRTPLTAIRGFTETLRDGALSDPATASRFLDTILKHSGRLERLVADLAVLSRAEAPDGGLTCEPMEIGPVLKEAVQGLESQARKKGLDLKVEGLFDLPEAVASARAIDQIAVNLIDNAIKYTPEGGTVTVRGTADDEHVILEVQDTGPGIARAHQERVFERFYRVDAGRSRELGGTGLGLAIVKHLAAAMGAEVELESTPGRGSTFRLLLPRGHLPRGHDTPP